MAAHDNEKFKKALKKNDNYQWTRDA